MFSSCRVIFRVDGNHNIGLGHVTRCIALAEMIIPELRCEFAIVNPDRKLIEQIEMCGAAVTSLVDTDSFLSTLEGSEIVVLDGYNFDEFYQRSIKAKNCKLIFIDDLVQQHFVADVIINHSLTANAIQYSKEPYTVVLTGSKYVLLRREFFLASTQINKQKSFRKVFVCLGGSDKENISAKTVNYLAAFKEIDQINLLLGSAYQGDIDELKSINSKLRIYQNLPAIEVINIMQDSNFAVVSASGIAYECASVGLPMIIGHYVDNQFSFYNALIQQENVVGVGSFKNMTFDKLKDVILQLTLNYDETAKGLVDGLQQQRYLKVFTELCQSQY